MTHDAFLRALDVDDEVRPIRVAFAQAGDEVVRPALGLEQRQERSRPLVPDQMPQIALIPRAFNTFGFHAGDTERRGNSRNFCTH